MPSDSELILRLLLAAALAGALGVEREVTDQPAGFRTHILVGLGATLFAIISAYGFEAIAATGPAPAVRADVTRVASQIVVGIGFLGGGAIIKYGATVRGLTTAASLWVTAAIATAVGLGAILLGTVTTIITLVALVGLRPLRSLVRRFSVGKEEFVLLTDRDGHLQEILDTVRRTGAELLEFRANGEGDDRQVHLLVRLPRGTKGAEVAAVLSSQDHVIAVDWNR